MKTLKSFKKHLESIKNLDQSKLDYYKSEFEKLHSIGHFTVAISDGNGGKTKSLNLNVESLIFLVDLVERMNEVS